MNELWQSITPFLHPQDVYEILEQYEEYQEHCQEQQHQFALPDAEKMIHEIGEIIELRVQHQEHYGRLIGLDSYSECCNRTLKLSICKLWLETKYGAQVLK